MIDPAPSRSNPQFAARNTIGRRALIGIMAAMLLIMAGGFRVYQHLQRERLRHRLLQADTAVIANSRELADFAKGEAKPLYAANCARCHGIDMRGDPALGAPNLTDAVWLFGDGSVFDIERTLLYGIRSEHSKSRNVTDMPAFGTTGRLSEAEIRNLVQYLLQLRGRPYDHAAADQGREVYFEVAKANCSDCHGETARGNANYGAPDLSVDVWNSGSDSTPLYNAIYYGQHRSMQGWIGILSLEQIRALAVYVYLASHHE